MRFKRNASHQFLLFCISFYLTLACTNPIQVGNKTQAGHRSIVGRVDAQSQIRALFASPVENQLGIISAKKEFDLLQISNTRSGNQLLLTENIFKPSIGATPVLSPQSKRIALVEPSQVLILELSDSSRQTFFFNQGTFQQVKWSSSGRFLNVLYSNDNRYSIYRIDVANKNRTLLYEEMKRTIRLMDYTPTGQTIYFYGASNPSSNNYYLYSYIVPSAKLDSLSTDSNITALAVSNDGLKVALVQSGTANSTNIKIFEYPAKNNIVQQEACGRLSSPYWKRDDSQILFSTDSGNYAIYTLESSACKFHSLSKRFDSKLLEKVWGSEEGQVDCLCSTNINRLSVLSAHSKSPTSLLNIRQTAISSPVWSADGKQIAYIQKDAVYLFNPTARVTQKIKIPFTFNKLVRWGPGNNELSFIYSNGYQNFLRSFNYATQETKEIEIPLNESISDFSWIPNTSMISFAFPEIPGIIFFNFNGTSLTDRTGSDLDIFTFRWSTNKSLIETIGNYAVIQGRSTLGIYFQSRNNINWLLHLTGQNAAYYDWCSDGKSLYYSGSNLMDDKQIYLEQVIFTND